MQMIRLTIAYDGGDFHGWQIQPNGRSVQAELEAAIQRLTGESVRLRGAGRTDAGVHARGQVAAFSTASGIPLDAWRAALNSRLPKDVAILSACAARPDFDPRRHALRKLYRYTIHADPVRPVLERRTRWHWKGRLDVAAMRAAAARLLGEHDFASFANQECAKLGKHTVRTVDAITIDHGPPCLTISVEGRSFLYNMVRNIVGTLVDVGAGRFAPAEMDRILAARDRQQAGQGAPAHGLCLEWIQYPDHRPAEETA